ncbi:MAG: UDP-N-acetylglucosamine--N-acetylmuramyl-(pentapeptide) pyrophosphoryl-undecaprenol N-acetylglucosamine transferase [bacterium]|nr:UDP-N-acetylglucosamine--N-acetylmuramyl-(pentapeptide) pyrophosphoryl-undecaprenol N-acetylglucosamine transferase [bacterium]
MKIFLIGGGSGGATSPLLAVAETLAVLKPKSVFFLVGTKKGIETKLLEATPFPITYLSIPAGKLRRYFSFANFFDIFLIIAGFFKSFHLIKKYKPDLVFGAGSYVQVPMAWAAYFSGIPVVIHQQDRELLLSTKLTAMAAKFITISFVQNRELPTFSGLFSRVPKSKILLTGNPVRSDLFSGNASQGRQIFGLSEKYPTILVMGGSGGSAKINSALLSSLPELVKYVQIIHVTGGKFQKRKLFQDANYHPYDFLGPELKHAYAASDLIIARGGMSTITELSHLGKPSILIPLPNSPQIGNVEILSALKCTVALFEQFLEPDLLTKLVRKILWSQEIQEKLRNNIKQIMPHDANFQIAKIIIKTITDARKNGETK